MSYDGSEVEVKSEKVSVVEREARVVSAVSVVSEVSVIRRVGSRSEE